jgi:hypothetical protein
MRTALIETFQDNKTQSIDIVARVLHINNIDKLRKCCLELVEEGVLEGDSTCSGSDMYKLTTYGKKIQVKSILLDKKLITKLQVRKMMCLELERKRKVTLSLENDILEFLKKNNFTTVYQIQHNLGEQQHTICMLQAVLYRLLLQKDIVKCGPILFIL